MSIKKTKIVCTLGPSSNTEDVIRNLMIEGMDVARLNFSHGSHEDKLKIVEIVKKVRAELHKPVALLLTTANATVTVCHTKTQNVAEECRRADIIVACCGVAKIISERYVKPDQVVIDVGMNVDDEGKLCGDVDYEKVSRIAGAVSPVPGGVGSITTAILLKHVVINAERQV